MPDANQPEITVISEKAKEEARLALHQHDVLVNIKYMDKRGNFLGTLWHYDPELKRKGENYTKQLVRKGYAIIQEDKAHKLGNL